MHSSCGTKLLPVVTVARNRICVPGSVDRCVFCARMRIPRVRDSLPGLTLSEMWKQELDMALELLGPTV